MNNAAITLTSQPAIAKNRDLSILAMLVCIAIVAPLVIYPVFLMKVLCFALFALAFNLLIGYVGLLSFGHAMFFGGAAYISGHVVKVWGWSPAPGRACWRRCASGSWSGRCGCRWSGWSAPGPAT